MNNIKSNLTIFMLLSCFLFSDEIAVKEIPLKGLITDRQQEMSGMDWYGNNLFLLPENLGGFLFVISKDDIYQSINSNNPNPITPNQISFITPDYSKTIPGFEGFESIAFFGDQFVVTLEAKSDGKMHGYIAWGKINPKTLKAIINDEDLLELPVPTQVKNMTYESALIHENSVILFYEANGKNLRKSAWQHIVSLNDNHSARIDFPNIEYRITDVTKIDHQNKFWAINYLWPGDIDRLNPAEDLISAKYGKGETHQSSKAVERLVEFQIQNGAIHLTNQKPLQIQLLEDNSRNWEGLVRLDKKGFLIVTDKFPGSLLRFISYKSK